MLHKGRKWFPQFLLPCSCPHSYHKTELVIRIQSNYTYITAHWEKKTSFNKKNKIADKNILFGKIRKLTRHNWLEAPLFLSSICQCFQLYDKMFVYWRVLDDVINVTSHFHMDAEGFLILYWVNLHAHMEASTIMVRNNDTRYPC